MRRRRGGERHVRASHVAPAASAGIIKLPFLRASVFSHFFLITLRDHTTFSFFFSHKVNDMHKIQKQVVIVARNDRV